MVVMSEEQRGLPGEEVSMQAVQFKAAAVGLLTKSLA